jgi:TM2 domain-containing membrane protein YozV
MKGEILIFDMASNSGKISGHDGKRYNFVRQSWQGNATPSQGQAVDFEAENQEAKEIIPLGVQQQAINQSGKSSTSRVTFVLLALFLGGLGIHNFVAGYTVRGVIQLAITICLGWLLFPLIGVAFWALFEVFLVTKSADGKDFA